MEAKPYKPPVRELASRIYVELAMRSLAVSDTGVKISPSAEILAKLAFELAEAFQGVEDGLNAANLPKNVGFQVDLADISAWSK